MNTIIVIGVVVVCAYMVTKVTSKLIKLGLGVGAFLLLLSLL